MKNTPSKLVCWCCHVEHLYRVQESLLVLLAHVVDPAKDENFVPDSAARMLETLLVKQWKTLPLVRC